MRKEVIYSFNQKYFIEICVVLFSQLRTFLVTEAAIFVALVPSHLADHTSVFPVVISAEN